MTKLETAEELLAYLVAHPERTSLAAFDLDMPSLGIAHRAEVVLPIGSVFKLAVLYAVAREVVLGRLSLDERVPMSHLEAFRLSGTGVDVHTATQALLEARGVSLAEGEIPLREVVRAMITVSDNEATDYLIMRLGPAAMEAVPGKLQLRDWEPPMPVSGLLGVWSGSEAGPRPRDWTTRCVRLGRQAFREEVYRRTEALRGSQEIRTQVAAAVERELSDPRIKRLAWTLPRASTTAVAGLMARIAADNLAPSGAAAVMREFLGWPLEAAPGLRDTFQTLGYKPGVIEGLLAGAWYGRRVGARSPRVVALTLHDLPLGHFRRMQETAAMQLFERRLLSDEGFFLEVHDAMRQLA